MIETFNKLDSGEYKYNYVKTQCPWIYNLAKNHIRRYRDYEIKASKTLLMLVWLIEINLKVETIEISLNHLDIIGDVSRKFFVKKEFANFLNGGNKENPNNSNKK